MLSEFQKKKLKRLFNFYDTNGNQSIEHKDIYEICSNFAKEYNWETGSEKEIEFRSIFLDVWKKLIVIADTNVDNKISLDEFMASYELTLSSEENYEKLVLPFIKNLFPVIASEVTGKISIQDFKKLYKCFRNDEQSAEVAFSKMDLNGDGALSKEEALLMFREFHLSQDPDARGNVFFGLL